ncbi:hypothetical protein Ahy_A02g009823 isoform A [Arachis hypogaea]|uniref:Uncharacterized protein n=1 Tax=Arachis hypogaea TaxID=3818 RepID=A0A445EI95_ARAHY|nr:hypothetical protein Ahy_A02g009823 isoform A [Arachis hypogaea]
MMEKVGVALIIVVESAVVLQDSYGTVKGIGRIKLLIQDSKIMLSTFEDDNHKIHWEREVHLRFSNQPYLNYLRSIQSSTEDVLCFSFRLV